MSSGRAGELKAEAWEEIVGDVLWAGLKPGPSVEKRQNLLMERPGFSPA